MTADTTMILFDYPLDYRFSDEVLEERDYVPTDSIADYYTSIPIGQPISEAAPHEILEELYIIEQDPYFDDADFEVGTESGTIANKQDLYRHLLYEAYERTGNEKELVGQDNKRFFSFKWLFGGKWTPRGRIQVWDGNVGETTRITGYDRVIDRYDYTPCYNGDYANCPTPIYRSVPRRDTIPGSFLPVEGVRVVVRQWFTVRKAYTNRNGDFHMGKVKGKARYVIVWYNPAFTIRQRHLFFRAETKGPKVEDRAWHFNIRNQSEYYYAGIFTAAHDYFHRHARALGISPPPHNIKIHARKTGRGEGIHVPQRRFYSGTPITIRGWDIRDQFDRIYGLTIHELAHAAHWRFDKSSYDRLVEDGYIIPGAASFVDDITFSITSLEEKVNQEVVDNAIRLLETWATTVEIVLTLERYRNRFRNAGYNYTDENQNFQFRTTFDERTDLNMYYTAAGYDMIDNFNQRNAWGPMYPIDRVSGYTIHQLERAMRDAKTWLMWRDNIRNRYNNPTEQFLDELFANWDR